MHILAYILTINLQLQIVSKCVNFNSGNFTFQARSFKFVSNGVVPIFSSISAKSWLIGQKTVTWGVKIAYMYNGIIHKAYMTCSESFNIIFNLYYI